MAELAADAFNRPSGEWTPLKAKALLPSNGARQLPAAIAEYEARLVPLKAREPKLDGSLARKTAEAFAPIGAKMRPDMSQEQAQFWATSLVLAFSDLPGFVIRAAVQEAIHIPYEFPTQMEKGVREIAERILAKHRAAIHRLRTLLDDILGKNVQPLLEAPAHEPTLSVDEILALPKHFRSLGVSSGAILPLDLAEAERIEAAKAQEANLFP